MSVFQTVPYTVVFFMFRIVGSLRCCFQIEVQAGASFTGSCDESFAEDEPQSFKLPDTKGHASAIWKVGCRQILYFVSLAFAMLGALSWQVGIY